MNTVALLLTLLVLSAGYECPLAAKYRATAFSGHSPLTQEPSKPNPKARQSPRISSTRILTTMHWRSPPKSD